MEQYLDQMMDELGWCELGLGSVSFRRMGSEKHFAIFTSCSKRFDSEMWCRCQFA